jgi:hypothetical protein
MKLVYDETTQKLIDFYQSRMIEIVKRVSDELFTMEGQIRYSRIKSLNPRYHPLNDDPEYQVWSKALEKLILLSVPKYLLSK